MSRIAIVSKYFGYNVGGAERSVLELLKREEKKGVQITVIVIGNLTTFGAKANKQNFPDTWEVRYIDLPIDIVRFRFIDYYMNKSALERAVDNLSDVDTLYAYGGYAPAVINAFQGDTVYIVRDEYGLGWNKNYYKGIRGAVQKVYHGMEAPLRMRWQFELMCAIKKSHLIANSNFIARELNKLDPRANVEIIYSQIDKTSLTSEYIKYQIPADHKGIIAIGDNILKGGDIVRKIAKRIPEEIFYMHDRKYKFPKSKDNLTFMPWESPAAVYARAKLVIIPSRWHEAYPRAAIEAQSLGIPVVASAVGCIPEAISDHSGLVKEVENIDQWETVIRTNIGRLT